VLLFSYLDLEKETIAEANVLLKHYIEVMEHMHLMEGLKTVLKISQLGNQYLQKSKVWELFKSDQKRCAEVVYFAVNFCYNLAAILEP
jgi:methionyl-tRNA synthetase